MTRQGKGDFFNAGNFLIEVNIWATLTMYHYMYLYIVLNVKNIFLHDILHVPCYHIYIVHIYIYIYIYMYIFHNEIYNTYISVCLNKLKPYEIHASCVLFFDSITLIFNCHSYHHIVCIYTSVMYLSTYTISAQHQESLIDSYP